VADMSEELIALRQSIVEGRYAEALSIVDELEEMSKKDTLRKIVSYLKRLMTHLIKNHVEQRLTNSWAFSVRDSLKQIQDLNLRSAPDSFYIPLDEWPTYIENAFEDAVYDAAIEALGGIYSPHELERKVDRQHITTLTLRLLSDTTVQSEKELSERINERLAALPGGDVWQKH
jgi:phenylalanyl-tRNA synthetase alpha subunit